MRFRGIILSALLGLSILYAFTFSGDIPYELKAMHQFLVGLKTELQEKIYLQTDREVYEAGEVVWFRAWQVSAATHVEPGFSRFLYVELVDKQDSVLERVKIPYRDSLFAGYLVLDEKLEQGNYYLRSYSRWMQNLGEDFIFKKKIYILNSGNIIGKSERINKRESDKGFDIQFFPEGGNLLTGNVQTVAFKAVGKDGFSREVTLEVYNDRHELLCTAESLHKGMGKFELLVHSGEHYYALVETEKGEQEKVELPVSESRGLGMEVRLNDSVLSYRVLCGDSMVFPRGLYLIGHVRGIPLPELCKLLEQQEGEIRLVSPPEGILQVLLTDTARVYSQRLCFLRNDSRPEVEVITDPGSFRPRSLLEVDIRLKSRDSLLLGGNLAVSVSDYAWGIGDTLQDDILSYLLLSSDLKGYIEEPGWYFAEDTAGRKKALDVLLLTQGWTRFKVEDILRGANAGFPVWDMELGQRISGRVEHFWSKKKDKKDVSLVLFGGNGYLEELNPDSAGHFKVDGLAFSEGTRFIIQGRNAKGKSTVEVKVDEDKFLQPQWKWCNGEVNKGQQEDFTRRFFGDYYYDQHGEKVYILEEAVIKQKKLPEIQQVFYDHKSNFMLDSARLTSMEDANLETIVRELPGIEMDVYNKRFMRMGKEIDVMIDNIMVVDMEAEFDRLESMQGKDILRVNLLDKMMSRAIYGSVNGVLVITTRPFRSRVYEPLNRVVFVPMGYQLGAEFYMPRYDVDSVRLAMQNQIDKRKTVYWNPQIRVDGNGCARFSFFTSDSGGPYFLRMEGILDDGTLCRKEHKIEFQ